MDDKTKELARQAGFDVEDSAGDGEIWFDEGWYTSLVERLDALIRHDEAKACAEHYLPIMRDAVEQAVLKEREACAKLCEELDDSQTNQSLLELSDCAEAIRQRGEK